MAKKGIIFGVIAAVVIIAIIFPKTESKGHDSHDTPEECSE